MIDRASDLSLFRVTLFVGPQPVEGKPFTQSTVYNVKKRSWKGGIQVAVEGAIVFDEKIIHATVDEQGRAVGVTGGPLREGKAIVGAAGGVRAEDAGELSLPLAAIAI